jgi:hypothetical protein
MRLRLEYAITAKTLKICICICAYAFSKNPGPNHDIKIANRSFENVAQFIYFGTTVTKTVDSGGN